MRQLLIMYNKKFFASWENKNKTKLYTIQSTYIYKDRRYVKFPIEAFYWAWREAVRIGGQSSAPSWEPDPCHGCYMPMSDVSIWMQCNMHVSAAP
jgi:hypothetical protein